MTRTLLSIAAASAVLFAIAFAACGASDSTLDGPCDKTCDCKRTDAPVKCAGEWVCNSNKTCEYTCATACSGDIYTCPDQSDCNGSICSFRKVAGCQ